MRSYFYALSLAAVTSMPVWAQQPAPTYGDPCPILRGDNYSVDANAVGTNGIRCVEKRFPYPNRVFNEKDEAILRIGALTITELRTIIAEIRGLRAEMRDYQQQLAQAKASYNATIKANTSAQEAWQVKALNETLDGVEKIPARLALDKNLREALLTSLKDELPKDQDFIETLRKLTAP